MPYDDPILPRFAKSSRPIFPKIGFERYQRLLGVAEEIEAHGPVAPTVLDVGSHDALLRKFIPSATYVECNSMVIPDTAPLPYKSKSFDVVVAADVLEHVQPDHRDYFIKELIRVSTSIVVFSFPNSEALDFEHILMEYFPTHKWLLEHRQMGLPSKKDITACLNSCNVQYVAKENGSLCGWLCSYMLHLTLGEHRTKLNEFLQRNCYEHENKSPAYRSIYTVWTKDALIKDNSSLDRVQLNPIVSIIIPVFNQVELTLRCLSSLDKTVGSTAYEIIVVDNNSTPENYETLRKISIIDKYIRNATNLGFSAACNQGARAAIAPYLVFLNNDTEVQPGWLEALVARAQSDPAIGIVGSKLLFPNGSLQHCGIVIVRQEQGATLLPRHVFLGMPPSALTNRPTKFQAVTAACLLIETELFHAVGKFDEKYWNGSEDMDLCFKVGMAGRSIVYEPTSVVIHHESKSGPERYAGMRQNNALLQERWKDVIRPDFIQSGAEVLPADSPIDVLDTSAAFTTSYLQAARHWWTRRGESLRPYQTTNIAKFIVHSCAPTVQHQNWGDAAFAIHVMHALQQAGQDAQVAYADKWGAASKSPCTVTIHIRGLYSYTPDHTHYNILWLISHPELVTEEELRAYDVVFCCSKKYARTIAKRFKILCLFLPQATTQNFINFDNSMVEQDIDVLFVGNNYAAQQGRCRKVVEDFLQTGIACNFKVVGSRWSGVVPPDAILGEYVPHDALAQLYSRAKIVLNDHHPTMAAHGFINNRTYDLMALGATQISCAVDGLQELGVTTYGSVDELRSKVQALLQNKIEREAYGARARKMAAAYTFEHAAASILKFSGEDIEARCRTAAALPVTAMVRPLSSEALERMTTVDCSNQQNLEQDVVSFLRKTNQSTDAPALGTWLFERLTRHGYRREPLVSNPQVLVFIPTCQSDNFFNCICSVLQQTHRSWQLYINTETLDNFSNELRNTFTAFRNLPVLTRGLGSDLQIIDSTCIYQLLKAEFLAVISPEVTIVPEFIDESIRALNADARAGYATSAILQHGARNRIVLPWQDDVRLFPAAVLRTISVNSQARTQNISALTLHDQPCLNALLQDGLAGKLLEQPLICMYT